MHPAHLTQIFLINKEQYYNKEQNKISSENYHDTERIKIQRNIRNQLIHIFNIPISKIGDILLQHFICHLRVLFMTCTLCRTIGCQCPNSRFPAFYLLGCRESRRTVFHLITAFNNVCDSRNVTARITFRQKRKQARYLKTEEKRFFPIIISFLFRVKHSYSY